MASAGKVMRAVLYEKYGGGVAGLKHVELPVPTPKKDEILIKIEATGINPVDWKIQKGAMRPMFPKKFPYVPCTDVGGEVLSVGAAVKKFKAGDKVLAWLDAGFGGGLAEYATTKESNAAIRPEEVSAAEAAALAVPGLTAHQSLTNAGIKLDGTGKPANVLVTAASGGVGHIAVQLAKLGGHHVTATCGARNIELVKSLGADEVLDYKTPEGKALTSPSGKKYDAVIHCTTGIPWSVFEPNLSKTGKVIDLTPGGSTFWNFAVKKITMAKKQIIPQISMPKHSNLPYLINLVKEGKLKPLIDSRHPLSKAEEAWAKSIEGHATGKIVVEP